MLFAAGFLWYSGFPGVLTKKHSLSLRLSPVVSARMKKTIEDIHPKAFFVPPLKEDVGVFNLDTLRAKNKDLRGAVESARKLIEAEDQRIRSTLQELQLDTEGKEASIINKAADGSDAAGPGAAGAAPVLPTIPDTVPSTTEGLAEQNGLLMDILESARKFVNAEEKAIATEQEGEKAIMLSALDEEGGVRVGAGIPATLYIPATEAAAAAATM